MTVFEEMRRDLNDLVKLVRESERYCTTVAARPELATTACHDLELSRERRIAELSLQFGIQS